MPGFGGGSGEEWSGKSGDKSHAVQTLRVGRAAPNLASAFGLCVLEHRFAPHAVMPPAFKQPPYSHFKVRVLLVSHAFLRLVFDTAVLHFQKAFEARSAAARQIRFTLPPVPFILTQPKMNRAAVDKFCERGILGFVLAILVFTPLAMGAVGAREFLVVQGLTIGVMLLWALRIWASPKPQLLWPPICWVVLAFAIYAIARYRTADIEYVARLEMIQVLMYALLFFAIVNNLYRQEVAQIIGFTLIFLAMVISACAIYQFFKHSNRVWNFIAPYPGRASGTFISPNNLAGFLEMLLPLAIAYVLAGRMKPVTRILLGYAALVMAAGLAVTFSRGGWAAAAVGLLALLGVLIGLRQHRIPALLLLIVFIGGGACFTKVYLAKTLTYIARVEGTVSNGKVELNMRRGMWTAAERMWMDHFWWGVGPAHYDYRFREYRPEF